MYTESNIKLSCNALWQKCVLATLYRAAATHPKIKLLQFKLIPCPGMNKAIPSLIADFTGELHRLCLLYTSDAADDFTCRSRWSPYH